MIHTPRRIFLKTSAAGVLAGLGDFSFLRQLRPVSAEEQTLETGAVQMHPEIEPLVQLLETTPREQLLEVMAQRIHQGTTYREILAALLLAGVRNVEPRPSVGFKFHAVLVVNSAHLASLSSPLEDRWLPIFWALDYFKSSQARDVQEGNWTMQAVDEAAVPPSHRAKAAFEQAMQQWDVEAADAAVAGLARSAGAHTLFELFAHYGVRDYRSIGHKAIFVANSWRTLQCIGWHHAEPVLRSLAYALLNHTGEPNPRQSDLLPDRPYRENQERLLQIRDQWRDGTPSAEATQDLLTTLRQGTWQDASDQVVELLNRGVAASSIYDALFAGASELMMRQRGIVALHALTTTNAMHYAFTTTARDETRRLILLQNAAFLPMFRQSMEGRGEVKQVELPALTPSQTDQGCDEQLTAIFESISSDRQEAARRTLAYLTAGNSPKPLIDGARRLIFLKGHDSHDYKYSSAVLEDYYQVSPRWRDLYLSAAVYNLRGLGDRDNQLVERTRAALQG